LGFHAVCFARRNAMIRMMALSRPIMEKASLLELACEEVGSATVCSDIRETSTLLLGELFSLDSSSFRRSSYLDSGLPSFFFLNIDCSIHDGIVDLGKRNKVGIERKREKG
jgi:hypothetical protein